LTGGGESELARALASEGSYSESEFLCFNVAAGSNPSINCGCGSKVNFTVAKGVEKFLLLTVT
jgi:hypothetical protein